MALTPKLHLSRIENQGVELCEMRLDEAIRDKYPGSGKLIVDVSLGQEYLTWRVQSVIRQRFLSAGWREVSFYFERVTLSV